MTTATTQPAIQAYDVEVLAARRLSPSFVRVTVTGDRLDALAGESTYDLRLKVVLPSPGHPLPDFAALMVDERWYTQWLGLDPATRGVMRTYTVRSYRGGSRPELDIDFVLHADGHGGPASDWAAQAAPGDELVLIGRNSRSTQYAASGSGSGIEWQPGSAARWLLVGDETALPAIAAIVEQTGADPRIEAVIEVPTDADIQPFGPTVRAHWLPRNGAPRGAALLATLRDLLPPAASARPELPEVDLDAEILWETAADPSGSVYAWVAGEAAVVRRLRRYLVTDAGLDRGAVSFMGYWREGSAAPG